MKGLSAAIKVGLVVLLVTAVGYGTYKSVSESNSGSGGPQYYALFTDASGLADKARVVIAGLTMGEIASARLEGRLARVTVRLREGTVVYQNASISKKSSSLLGEYYLEIDPGAPEVVDQTGKLVPNTVLPDGSQIKTVHEPKSIGDLTNDIARVLPRVDEVLVEIRGLAADARKVLNTSIANIARNIDKLVEEDAKVVDSILKRIDRIAEDIEGITGTSGDEVKRILASVERSAYELEDLLKTTKGEIQLTGKELRDRLERIDRSISALEETLEGTASIANKIDDNQGTLGRLVNDPAIADNIEQVTEDVKGFTSGLFSLQTLIGIRSEANLFAKLTRETVWIELHTKNDKYYLLEIVSDTRGSIEQTYEVDPASGQLVRHQTIEPYGLRFSFMLAKRLGWATFRVGVKESTGGAGFDADFFGGKGRLSLDVFDFQFDKYPRMRITTAWNFYRYLYIYAGVDDVLNKFQEIPVTGDNVSGGSPSLYPFGRDVFIGAGIRFSDEDLRTLLFIGGGALAAMASGD
jgi:phospholipid/cholesterol/gamma-HCH transport system substrate-binding protein